MKQCMFTESVVESATLSWLENLGWSVRNGLIILAGHLLQEKEYK